ncbi:hypothetical protein CVT24_003328 [Panaeolus cyanescens]|uniref:Uncharacterized protein n=1 Tax=Panaeolus cyanescens TaxID=181874 RepID=A0A409Y704_9AGAR|nr:hypothetical protein CVT24_003328 [Panaeolus cyanescens]
MPPKVKPKAANPSQDLVPTGPRHVSAAAVGKPARVFGEKKKKETTERALVLRNGKYGAMGSGELMLARKMSGREKLDLLAEDMVKKSQHEVLAPFNLEKCLKIARSQRDVYIDDILSMREADLFCAMVEKELEARKPPTKSEVNKTPSHVARQIATKIHNSYMLASGWKFVYDNLNRFSQEGVTDRSIKSDLQQKPDLRNRYLVVTDVMNQLVDMCHQRFSQLTRNTERYARYFKERATDDLSNRHQQPIVFDYIHCKEATKSFLDSLILELCFPRGDYPMSILYRILNEAVTEAPREANRFPQAMYDAIGDLSISVQLQELLQTPLFGQTALKEQTRQYPEEYELWVDAQLISKKASEEINNFKDICFPLAKLKSQAIVDNVWKAINNNYRQHSGNDDELDDIWGLADDLNFTPRWTGALVKKKGAYDYDSDDDQPGPLAVARSNNKAPGKARLALKNEPEPDSDDSMPGLQSVSNTSDEAGFDDSDSSDDDFYDSGASETESEYDDEEEEDRRELIREAMDIAANLDYYGEDISPDLNPFQQEDDRKGNPFLKLLGSLRGRMFTSDPKMTTPTTRTEPRPGNVRGAFRATRSGAPKAVPTGPPPKPKPASASGPAPAKAQPTAAPQHNLKTTMEEVDDEDDASVISKKKKKKKPKKKKKAPTATDGAIPETSPPPSVSSPPTSPVKPAKATPPGYSPSLASSTASFPVFDSSSSVQSGRSYLQSREPEKQKVKSRPDHASIFSKDHETKRKGIFSKFLSEKEPEPEPPKGSKNIFSKISTKAKSCMQQLFVRGDQRSTMKWDNFVKMMVELGFDYDPSTAGSSVRFDPPNKADPPITVHKPHPESYIKLNELRRIAYRLQERYGWNAEDLLKDDN